MRTTCLAILLLVVGCSDAPNSNAPPAEAAESVVGTEWREAPSADGTYFVRWRPLVDPIPLADPFDIEVEVWTDESMTERAGFDAIYVDAAMPHHGHGMNVAPEITERPDGSWVARGMLMHMPGRWQLYIDCFEDGRLERAQWSMWLSG